MRLRHFSIALLAAAFAGAHPARGQESAPDSLPREATKLPALVTLGSIEEDRLRLNELLGKGRETTALLRSPSVMTPRLRPAGEAPDWALITPKLGIIWNSDLPFSLNDGALWAGRGINLHILAGARFEYGPIRVIFAPELVFEQNREFQVLPYPQNRTPIRSPFASPWRIPPESADLPLRFGTEPRRFVGLGQSSLTFAWSEFAVGVATENLWWGPGIRNAILLSNQAPGFPHAFFRTNKPISTPLGSVQGHWLAGRLSESAFFDSEPGNDVRSLTAIALTLRPSIDPNLDVGAARSVFTARDPLSRPVGAALDAFRNVGRPNRTPSDSATQAPEADQIFSVFGRWVFPESGFETYLEWARFEQPASFADLLEAPNHSQGYTLGLQWAKPTGAESQLRLQTELTYLEPSTTYRQREVISTYTSRVVEHGYTHRGQILGASVGPGGSGQWLALDHIGPEWRVGAFGGRVRWENAALYSVVRGFRREDVSIFGGLRGGVSYRGLELGAEWSSGMRLNYLFQAYLLGQGDSYRGVDIANHSLRLSLSVAPR